MATDRERQQRAAEERTGALGLVMARRHLLRYSACAVGAVALGSSSAGCGAIAGAFAGNPAVAKWFPKLAVSVGAELVADGIVNGMQGAWAKWGPGVKKQVAADPLPYAFRDLWCHAGASVVLAAKTSSAGAEADPMNDRLVVCVNGGDQSVVLEPWAWQAVAMCVDDLTDGKDDDELAQMRRLCALGLLPRGVKPDEEHEAPLGSVGSITYPAFSGLVEIGWFKNEDNSKYVQIVATGIPDKNNKPLSKRYDLPTTKA